MPKILIPKRGISENSSLTTKRSTAHSPHVVTTPKIRPMGTAVLHQFNASRRTNRIICCLLIPMQRIIPKNLVLWATLLFILLEIIKTPAIKISRNRTTAIEIIRTEAAITQEPVYEPETAYDSSNETVYITDSGNKYHRSGCRTLKKSKHAISKSSAVKQGYEACGVCHP